MEEWIGGGLGGGGEEDAALVLLPGERGAEEGERLAGAGGGLEEGVAVPLPAGAVEGGYDATHERELGSIGPVGELHGDAPDLVDVGFRARIRVLGGGLAIHRCGHLQSFGLFGFFWICGAAEGHRSQTQSWMNRRCRCEERAGFWVSGKMN